MMEDKNTKENRISAIRQIAIRYTESERLKNIDKLIPLLDKMGFFTAPASTKYHGAYEGGLFDHSWNVWITLEAMTNNENLEWTRPESPFIVAIFHDICKCDQYKKVVSFAENSEEPVIRFTYNPDTAIKGHGDKSVIILNDMMPLTEEETLCIRYHMGAYEKSDWQQFDEAIRKYPTVLWTHTADMIASKLIDE